MPNKYIISALSKAWAAELGNNKKALDVSVGDGATTRILKDRGYNIVATEYSIPPYMSENILRVGGADLNEFLPFKGDTFDAINLTEVIEHIENQPQLIREFGRIIKEGGVIMISTPNILNIFSRLRFLFTGFLKGRLKPVHYSKKPDNAPNIYLIHFYELYYLLFHYGFEVENITGTRVKFASVFFAILFFPLILLLSLLSIIYAEKDPIQRHMNWRIMGYLLSPSLLLADNFIIKARKKGR